MWISVGCLYTRSFVVARNSAAAKAASKVSAAEHDSGDLPEDDLLEAVVKSASTPCVDAKPRERRRVRERKSRMLYLLCLTLVI